MQRRELAFGSAKCTVLEQNWGAAGSNELCTCLIFNMRSDGAVSCSDNALVSYMIASKCSRNHFISEKCEKEYNHLSYISFKRVPLSSYTHLAAILKMLETFLETILWKPIQLFRRILYEVSSSTKASPLQFWFQSRKHKTQLEPGVGDAPVLSHCFSLGNPWPKLTGVLEHCQERETTCWFSIFRGVSFWPHS